MSGNAVLPSRCPPPSLRYAGVLPGGMTVPFGSRCPALVAAPDPGASMTAGWRMEKLAGKDIDEAQSSKGGLPVWVLLVGVYGDSLIGI